MVSRIQNKLKSDNGEEKASAPSVHVRDGRLQS